jgi:hypothetical protein
MARPYSQDFLANLQTLNPNNLGVQLAKLCVKANLPTLYVARKLSVSRYTIHSWFRGQYIRNKNKIRVNKFIEEVTKGFDSGKLPAPTLSIAQQYLDSVDI